MSANFKSFFLQTGDRIKRIPERRLVLLIASAVFLLFLYQIFQPWFPTFDSGIYMELARSLSRGEGYRYMGYVHNKYPPMFPLLLSPFYLFSQDPIMAIRLFLVLIAAAAVSLVFLLFKEEEPPGRGLLVAGWFFLTPPLIYYSALVLTDVTYLAFSLFSFVMLDRWRKTGKRQYLAGLGIGMSLTVLTRIIGFVLPCAIWLGSLLKSGKSGEEKSERPVRKLALAALVIISLWQIRSIAVPEQALLPAKVGDSNSYFNELRVKNRFEPDGPLKELSQFIRRFETNLKFNINKVIPAGVGWSHFGVYNFDLIFLALMLWGFGLKTKTMGEKEIYVILYMSILLNWPTSQGTRYIMPIVPFLINYLVEGIKRSVNFIGKLGLANKKRLPAAVLIVLAVIGVIYGYFLGYDAWAAHRWLARGGSSDKDNHFYFQESILWAKRHFPKNTVLMSDRSSWTYHLSGLKTYPIRTANLKELLDIIYKYKIDYLITSELTGYGKPLRRAVRNYPNLFKPIIGNRWCGIYSVAGSLSGSGENPWLSLNGKQ